MHLAYGTAEDCGILAVDVYETVVNGPVACHDAVCRGFLIRQIEVGATCRHEGSDLHETVFVKQSADSLCRR